VDRGRARAQAVEVEILLPESGPPVGGATAYVRVEDVSVVDAPATVVAEHVTRDISLPGRGTFPVRLWVSNPLPQSHYAVSVHLDLDGDGLVGVGDYRSVQSYPVLTWGYPAKVRVTLARVV
jgi:hypothetical protein